jgi:porphobilinogen deaminase
VARLVDEIDDAGVRLEIEAERLLLAETGAGCRSALGGLAEATPSGLRMTSFVHDDAGPRRAVVEAGSAAALVERMRSELRL